MIALFEGIIAAITALAVELSPPVFGLVMAETSLLFVLFTASVEEIIKYAFIYNHYLKLNAKEKILASAFFVGLGFALVDAITKLLSHGENITLPIMGIFFVHIITTTLLGAFFWKKGQKPTSLSFLLVILNIFLHFLYNFLILRH